MTTLKLICLCAATAIICLGCASPTFQPASKAPPGRGVVYVYAPAEAIAQGKVSHNGEKLGALSPNQYFVHYPQAGTNVYGIRVGFQERGGVVGLLLTHNDPEATRIRIESGKTYYVRLVGFGAGASLWRVEESTALSEIQKCHIVNIEKTKRVEITTR